MRLNKINKEDKPTGLVTAATTRTNRFRGSLQVAPPSTAQPLAQPSAAPASPTSLNKSTATRFLRSPSFSSSAITAAAASVVPSQQRIAALVHDAKRYWKYRRQQHNHRDTLPHHYSRKSRVWHVDFPKRIVWWTATVFLVGPLILFTWSEVHRKPQTADTVTPKTQTSSSSLLPREHHNVFPDWFPEEDNKSDDKEDATVDVAVANPVVQHDSIPIVHAIDDPAFDTNSTSNTDNVAQMSHNQAEVAIVVAQNNHRLDNETIIQINLDEEEEEEERIEGLSKDEKTEEEVK
jgi:hypothetical protein